MPAPQTPRNSRPKGDPPALEKKTAGSATAGETPQPQRFLWRGGEARLAPVARASALPLDLLCGIESQAARLVENTRRFSRGFPAHHALLWGARGNGKSSLVKSVAVAVATECLESGEGTAPALVGILGHELASLPTLFEHLAEREDERFLLFLDDLGFSGDDPGYAALKSALEGGVVEMPSNCLLYATSNRRHLILRERIETETSQALRGEEVVEDRVSLSDRFGLWLGIYPMDETTYLNAVRGYGKRYHLTTREDEAKFIREARKFSRARGGLSGRVAWHFIQEWAGERGKPLGPLQGGQALSMPPRASKE